MAKSNVSLAKYNAKDVFLRCGCSITRRTLSSSQSLENASTCLKYRFSIMCQQLQMLKFGKDIQEIENANNTLAVTYPKTKEFDSNNI